MNNIFEVYQTNTLNYVKEHIKEIHIYTFDFPDQMLWRAYLILDDDTAIGGYYVKGESRFRFVFYLYSESGKREYRQLDFTYSDLSIRDLTDNIIDHGFVDRDAVILEVGLWTLMAD